MVLCGVDGVACGGEVTIEDALGGLDEIKPRDSR